MKVFALLPGRKISFWALGYSKNPQTRTLQNKNLQTDFVEKDTER